MLTLKELRKQASLKEIKGRSKMNKEELMKVLNIKAPVKKSTRKPIRKRSRKVARKISRKPIKKGSRKSIRKRSRKPSGKIVKNSSYHSIIMDYINGDDKAINKLTIQRRKALLHSVKFHGTEFGRVEYFKKQLNKHLGAKWRDRVLDLNDDLSDVPSVKRLGIPGRHGTTIQLYCDGKYYTVKITRKGVSCGDGATGGMGFLKQARMQQLASEYGVTCPVDAVYCGHKTDVSFMVMPDFKERMIDRYSKGSTLSLKHQKQLWNLFLKLDSHVGILHDDLNCLSSKILLPRLSDYAEQSNGLYTFVIDFNNNVKLIDFDRSVVIEKKHIKKYGCYPNLYFIWVLNCFKLYGIKLGTWLGPKIKSMKEQEERRYVIKPVKI
jgi:hypothetical protein